MLTLFAFSSPLWTHDVCNHFAIVEWIQALVIALSAETVLAIRVYALTMRNKWLASLLGFIMISQCTIVFYVMAQPMKNTALSVPELPMDSFHVCILYSDAHIESAYLATSIAFDCCVFAVTLWATLRGRFSQDGIDSTIRRDGAIYFCVILSGNVIWMLMSLFARPGLKLMNAQPSMIMTSIMITRLTLSLRRAGRHVEPCDPPSPSPEWAVENTMKFWDPSGTKPADNRASLSAFVP